jgi:NADPH-dependent 2,4-dienoyl-CoA reductase/sulfur reductase-like enzyme
MSNLHTKYLLIGGGLASISAAEAIRERDREGELLIVGQEINRPYHRPPLSKEFLRREKSHDEVFTHPSSWYEENRVRLRTGRRAARLDVARRAVTLDNAEEISFDRLLIATGAHARHLHIPGADLPNLYYLRTIEDAERLHHAIEQAQRGKRSIGDVTVAVIGGGVLGVELAASLKQMGLKVELVVGGDHPWGKFAGEVTGKFVGKYLENKGVSVQVGPRPVRLEGDGRVQRVVLTNGTPIACDFAVAAVGAMTNRDLLRGTSIAAEKAILVDARCETSVVDIFAAGDCAAILDPLFGKHRVLDHWDNAVTSGKIAGANMAGDHVKYDVVNTFFSDVFELSINAWGEARFVDHRIVRGNVSVEKPDFVEFGIGSDGRIAQVIAVNHAGEDDTLKALVKGRVQTGGKEEMLREPGGDLRELL